MQHVSLDDIEIFIEVARAGSFSQAAINLGMSNGSVSRRVSALEKQLNVRLLDRNTRKIRMTQPAMRFFDRSASLLDELRLSHEALREDVASPSGTIKVSAPVDFGIFWLAPLLSEFADLYPSVNVLIELAPRHVDLIAERIDIAIRIGPFVGNNLVATNLGLIHTGLYASSQYVAANGKPEHSADLANHRCIYLLNGSEWRFTLAGEVSEVTVDGRFATNNMGLMLQLCKLGQGIAVLPKKMAAKLVSSEELIELLPDYSSSDFPVHALTLSRSRPHAVNIFLHFIKDKLIF